MPMQKNLDSLDVKILACLDEYGPRNLSLIARRLDIHTETLRKRVERLVSRFFIEFLMMPYHTNIGLKKSLVFADAVPGKEEFLPKCMKANDFWIYIGRYYGRFEGCYGVYAIPVEFQNDFKEFVQELKKSEIIRNVHYFWSTCVQTVNPTENWFDEESGWWVFNWDNWVKEFSEGDKKLPPTLVEPERFPINADDIDVLILAKLEVDYTRSLTEIARILNMNSKTVEYHYRNHILKRGLIEKTQVFFDRFNKETADFYVFTLYFDSEKKTAKFASSLLDKPFAYGLGKIIGEHGIVAHLYLPKKEFRAFIKTLSQLIREGHLQSYEYVIEDIREKQGQTISYEYFKNGEWVYDHKRHLETLRKIVNEVK